MPRIYAHLAYVCLAERANTTHHLLSYSGFIKIFYKRLEDALPKESVCCKTSTYSGNTKETHTSLLRDNVGNTITVLEWKNKQAVLYLPEKCLPNVLVSFY